MKSSLALRLVIGCIVTSVVLYFWPLFRIRRIDNRTSGGGNASGLDPSIKHTAGALLEAFWNEQLPEATKSATKVEELFALASTDAQAARKKYGREVGLGGPTYFFVRGTGTIESVDEDQCRLRLQDRAQRIVLVLGVLSGNAVRDATGLIRVESFPNSQDFNNVSAELNRRCEASVIEPIRSQLVVGALVDFVGCGKVSEGDSWDALELIPVQLSLSNRRGQSE